MTTERDLRNQMAYARKEAIEEGHAEGLAKGEYDAKAAIAAKLIDRGMKPEEVSEITGLTLDELKRI